MPDAQHQLTRNTDLHRWIPTAYPPRHQIVLTNLELAVVTRFSGKALLPGRLSMKPFLLLALMLLTVLHRQSSTASAQQKTSVSLPKTPMQLRRWIQRVKRMSYLGLIKNNMKQKKQRWEQTKSLLH